MSAYILDLTASFVIGGAWVMLASVAAQRFGCKVGDFIAGLPATAVRSRFNFLRNVALTEYLLTNTHLNE